MSCERSCWIAGPYTQTGGAMNFGIASLAYFGQIAFAASAPLTGTLSVSLNGGYFPSAEDSFVLLTYGSGGPSYILLTSSNLTSWTARSTNTPAVTAFTVVDPDAGNFSRRFYRALASS
jgi:hypothetical protein